MWRIAILASNFFGKPFKKKKKKNPIQLAMDFESFKQARARRRGRDAVGLYLLQDAGNEDDRNKKINRRCWVCDEVGHIARFCKQRVPRHPLNGGRVQGNGAAGQKSGNGQ